MFSYRGNVVALDLLGAGLPLVMSLILIAIVITRTRNGFNKSHLVYYILLTIGIGVVAGIDYVAYDYFYGGLAVPTLLILFTTIFPAALIQFVFDKKDVKNIRNTELLLLKSYPVGTFGMILSDLFRTFSGTVNVSPQIIGANWWLDGVFQNGFYLMFGYFIITCLYSIWLDRSQLRQIGLSRQH